VRGLRKFLGRGGIVLKIPSGPKNILKKCNFFSKNFATSIIGGGYNLSPSTTWALPPILIYESYDLNSFYNPVS
jgi:hypothetical protein